MPKEIVYWLPDDLTPGFEKNVTIYRNFKYMIREGRDKIIEKMPYNYSLLVAILPKSSSFFGYNAGKNMPFMYVEKEPTETVKDAADYFGIRRRSVSKTIVVQEKDSEKSEGNRVYLLTALGGEEINLDNISIEGSEGKLPPLEMVEEDSVYEFTGMPVGSCSPFLPFPKYFDNIEGILFKSALSTNQNPVDFGIGPEHSIFMAPKAVYEVLSTLSPKVKLFPDK